MMTSSNSIACIPLRFAAGILPGFADPVLRARRHDAAVVEQRHQLEAETDVLRRALRPRAMDAGVQLALVAFLDDLLIDLQDLRLFAVELRLEPVGEAEVG